MLPDSLLGPAGIGAAHLKAGAALVSPDFDKAEGEFEFDGSGQNPQCNWQQMFEKARIAGLGRKFAQDVLGLGVPYRWTRTRFTHCCNGAWRIRLEASDFPSVAVYVRGKKVFTHKQKNLLGFMFAGNGALAPGGLQGTPQQSLVRDIKGSGGAAFEEFDPESGKWVAKVRK